MDKPNKIGDTGAAAQRPQTPAPRGDDERQKIIRHNEGQQQPSPHPNRGHNINTTV